MYHFFQNHASADIPFLSDYHRLQKVKGVHAFGNSFTDDSLHEGDREKHFVVVLDILTEWDKQWLGPVKHKEALKQMNQN